MPEFSSLSQWLDWQSQLHHSEIDLTLERVASVYNNLNLPTFNGKVITIAGTNGKGSSGVMLESIYRQAGFNTARYSSPHIKHYNERICVNAKPVSDDEIVQAFAQIDSARGDISLTYFEFGTLAAFIIFAKAQPDVLILEVGMGGRMDAVNIIDADVALITNIALDHQSFLGDTREMIAIEKGGIMRRDRPAVINDADAPDTLLQQASQLGAITRHTGVDFHYSRNNGSWEWRSDKQTRAALPLPALNGAHQIHNAAGVLAVIECLQPSLPVTAQEIKRGLLELELTARCQIIPGDIIQIIDVAHNQAACQSLADTVQDYGITGKIRAVFSCLADKDPGTMLAPFSEIVDEWFIYPVKESRARPVEEIRNELENTWPVEQVHSFGTNREAYLAAINAGLAGDAIVVFGSFITVAELELLRL